MEQVNSGKTFLAGTSYELVISDLNHRGEGVGKAEGFTLFVPGALPGETVRAEITKNRGRYGECRLEKILDTSSKRVDAACPFFAECGGCRLQHFAYEEQLKWKREVVAQSLKRLAGLNVQVDPVVGMANPWHFRNKARIHFNLEQGKINVGFFAPASKRVIDINQCPVQHPANEMLINALRRALKNFIKKYNISSTIDLPVSGAAIRTSFADGKAVIAFEASVGRTYINRLKDLAALLYAEAEKLISGVVLLPAGMKNKGLTILAGSAELTENIAEFQYNLAPQSFFQVNPGQAEKLYDIATTFAGNTSSAFDLYCGTGTFTLFLSKKALKVTGTDSTSEAIINARGNARLNCVENVTFLHRTAEASIELLEKADKPRLVCLNPPRNGCSVKLLQDINKINPETIIYISCNPATLARDLSVLSDGSYQPKKVQPVDMFPHTTHVETVALLSRI